MQSKSTTVEQYLGSLPDDRRAALTAIRKVILANLDRGPDGKSGVGGFTEGMQYGMIGYAVPHSVFPPGYHCDPKQPLPYAGLASQKNHMSLYLMCVYGNPDAHAQFQKQWLATGKKLDMGKACIRFKKLDDVALDVIGDTIKRITAKKYIDFYTKSLAATGRDVTGKKIARATASTPAVKPSAKKKPTKQPAATSSPSRSKR